jgi:hypothetical protein
MKKKITLIALLLIAGYIYSSETYFNTIVKDNNIPKADTTRIKKQLTLITKTDKSRNYKNLKTLNKIGTYIYDNFKTYADTTYYQKYDVQGNEYKNVIAVFGSKNTKTIVIGAHYDVCEEQEGADDNASGTVALLELARMLQGKKLNYRIELVAYTLEEPPFFRTKQMGSYIHAKSLKENKVDVYGMVCLEMIAYFDDAKNSQSYPLGILKLIYGNKANYITLVNQFGKGKFARKFSNIFKKANTIKTKKFVGPKSMEGIDFSDHMNYWSFGYSAVMLTDTSFYRNDNYHEKTDTMETLNIPKMAQVIDGVFLSIVNM